jgi:hypothetical protein
MVSEGSVSCSLKVKSGVPSKCTNIFILEVSEKLAKAHEGKITLPRGFVFAVSGARQIQNQFKSGLIQ